MNSKSRLKCKYCGRIVNQIHIFECNRFEWIVKVDLYIIIANQWIVKVDLNIGNYILQMICKLYLNVIIANEW